MSIKKIKEINTDKDRNRRFAEKRPYDLSVVAEEYKTMTQPQLAEKYGVSVRTIARWLDVLGAGKRTGNWHRGGR